MAKTVHTIVVRIKKKQRQQKKENTFRYLNRLLNIAIELNNQI